jgi:hypothetical protein
MAGIAALAFLGGCGGGASTTRSTLAGTTSAPSTNAKTTHEAHPGGHQPAGKPKPKHKAKPKPKPPAVPPGVSAALHAYVDALDAHDGQALCKLFEPGALDALKLPVGAGCSGLGQSIGYDPGHGLPQWDSARMDQVKNAVHADGGVRATVTIVDRYAGNPQPSIEDDVVFLRRGGGDWLIEQPSVTIYRAIGIPNPPPSVLAAPGSG